MDNSKKTLVLAFPPKGQKLSTLEEPVVFFDSELGSSRFKYLVDPLKSTTKNSNRKCIFPIKKENVSTLDEPVPFFGCKLICSCFTVLVDADGFMSAISS